MTAALADAAGDAGRRGGRAVVRGGVGRRGGARADRRWPARRASRPTATSRCARWRSSTRRGRFESWPSRRPRRCARAWRRRRAGAAPAAAKPSAPSPAQRRSQSFVDRTGRTRWNVRRASARSRCSIAASRCAAAAGTARRSTPGRRRSRSRPTTASTRRTSSGCARDLGRLRAQTPPVDVASALRVQRPSLGREAASASTACCASSPSTRYRARRPPRRAGRRREDRSFARPRHARRLRRALRHSQARGRRGRRRDRIGCRVVVRECVACAGAHSRDRRCATSKAGSSRAPSRRSSGGP